MADTFASGTDKNCGLRAAVVLMEKTYLELNLKHTLPFLAVVAVRQRDRCDAVFAI